MRQACVILKAVYITSTLVFAALFIHQQIISLTKLVRNQEDSPDNKQSRPHKKHKALLPIKSQEHFGQLLEARQYRIGAELGVQMGLFSEKLLKSWPSCAKFYLIDVWKQQHNYVDLANTLDWMQENVYNLTKERLAPWKNKTIFLRMLTSEAIKYIEDGSLDFVYVDARHDYCGVNEDIRLYWPKIRSGGIMAGDDYVYANERIDQDWSLCANGTIHPGSVWGAVDDFASENGLQVSVTYERGRSWYVQKIRSATWN